MNFFDKLRSATTQNDSLLCVGLDPDPMRFPPILTGDPDKIFTFSTAIVDATADLVCAFKPQIAYFAAQGAEKQLERLIEHIRKVAPHIPVILDAKRGDIGATAKQYAVEAFERYGADAVTLSPFMGFDTIEPYLEYKDKGVYLLCRTSNAGGSDLQNLNVQTENGSTQKLYEHLARLAQEKWNTNGQMGLVVGATYPEELRRIRDIAPDLPLLIPGVGAQGGDASATVHAAWSTRRPITVNSSRAILYASSSADYAKAARAAAIDGRNELRRAQLSALNSLH